MPDDRILVRVSSEELPSSVRPLIDSSGPRPAGSRFLARRRHVVWAPAAWLAGLLILGGASVRATLQAGLDPESGDERFVYGAMTALCLVGAIFAARKLLQGITERRDVRRGSYRQGLHVLGREGLLIAGRDTHTWVPREQMPAPMEISGPASGAGHSPTYAFIMVDDRHRTERLDCGITTRNALWLWVEDGQLPEGGGWA